jgi:hypothetical protein
MPRPTRGRLEPLPLWWAHPSAAPFPKPLSLSPRSTRLPRPARRRPEKNRRPPAPSPAVSPLSLLFPRPSLLLPWPGVTASPLPGLACGRGAAMVSTRHGTAAPVPAAALAPSARRGPASVAWRGVPASPAMARGRGAPSSAPLPTVRSPPPGPDAPSPSRSPAPAACSRGLPAAARRGSLPGSAFPLRVARLGRGARGAPARPVQRVVPPASSPHPRLAAVALGPASPARPPLPGVSPRPCAAGPRRGSGSRGLGAPA